MTVPVLDRIEELREAVRRARTSAEARRYRLAVEQLVLEERGYEEWLRTLFPKHVKYGFAAHHHWLWEWFWSLELDVRPARARVAIWNRGAAKSMIAELGILATGARARRRYWLYVCGTQNQANQHISETISRAFELSELEHRYPTFAQRAITKYGYSRSWKQNRLITSTGFTIHALGLDAAVRGVRVEDVRPDGIVLDDVDDPLDTEATTRKKVEAITRDVIPTGGPAVAIAAVQNLIHPTGVFARLAGLVDSDVPFGEFLVNRDVSGPVPAVRDLVIKREPHPEPEKAARGETRATIVAGTPTWPEGKSIEVCQAELDDEGETAWLMENQHEVELVEGAMFSDVLELVRHEVVDGVEAMHALLARMERTTVWCDPAITDTQHSDSHGVQADGIDNEGTIWRLRSWEQRASPTAALERAILWAYELGSGHVGIETDQGGETWGPTYREALATVLAQNPALTACWCGHLAHEGLECPQRELCGCDGYAPFRAPPQWLSEKAGTVAAPKEERSARMHADYQRPGPPIVHVYGYPDDSTALDAALGRVFVRKPFDLADAAYWSWKWLRQTGTGSTGAGASESAGRVTRLRRR